MRALTAPRVLLATCGVLLALASLSAQNPPPATHSPDIAGAWLSKPLQWTYPPKAAGLHERQAPAALLYFDADHDFVLLYASVIQQNHKYTISVGDGEHWYFGTWSGSGKIWRAEYRLVDESIHAPGHVIRGSFEPHALSFEGKTLKLDQTKFERVPELDEKMKSELAYAKNCAANGPPSGGAP